MGTTSASEFETQAAGQQALNLMVPGGEAIIRSSPSPYWTA
jgi:hypothetical protein